jgi:glutamate-1-semialdehyde aminotransferase
VQPDLATFGKALANGYPLAALVGRAEVFDAAGEVFITSTFAGESTALAAALAVLEELQGSRFLERLEHCGHRLRHSIDRWGAELGPAYSLHTLGHACRFKVQVEGPDAVSSRLARSVIHQEMARRSVLLARVCYPCLAWTDADLDLFAAAVRESTQVLRRAIAADGLKSALDGELIGDVPIL